VFTGDINDLDPGRIASISILKDASAYSKYGDKGRNGVVEINTKPRPLIYVDGKPFNGEVNDIDAGRIESVNVLKDAAAVSKYGERAKDGVIEITTRETAVTATDTVPQKQSSKGHGEPSIDKEEWRKFLEANLLPFIEEAASKGAPPGQYTVVTRFAVEKDGTLSNIKTIKDPGYGLGKKTTELLKNSPRWQPAMAKGKAIRSFHTQPVTFVIAEE
jgi:TonB-dependent SusC/RagA subfamily outer membrane receptor